MPIWLMLVFLFSTTGIHLDLSFCCGQIESISFIHNEAEDVHGCCEHDATSCTDDENEINIEPVLLDVVPANEFHVQILQPQVAVRSIHASLSSEHLLDHNSIRTKQLTQVNLPVLHQQFRC